MTKERRNNIIAIFSASLLIIAAIFIVSYLRNYEFNEIETNKGTQFDPKIADILLKLIKSGRIEME